jgi:hypothetical protein
VEELYTWERAADAFDQLYQSIARKPANAVQAEIEPECYDISPGKM